MTDQRLYKIVVDSWPTGDGNPWPRFVDAITAAEREAQGYGTPVPSWMLPLVYEDYSGMDEFARYNGDDSGWGPPSEICGWVLPSPTVGPKGGRRYWHSKAAAEKWISDAAKWGAKAHLVTSDPITWPTDD